MTESLLTKTLCIILAVGITTTNTQYLTTEPLSQPVPTNGTFHLKCSSPNATSTLWFRGHPEQGFIPILNDPPRLLITDDNTLHLSSFHAIDDIGLYYCLVTMDTGAALRSCPANISHARIHHLFTEEPPSEIEVALGSTALLPCQFNDSNPSAIVHWKKNGHPIIPDNERVILTPSGYLYIMNVTENDSGVYECLADNIVTEKTRRSNESLLTVNASLPTPSLTPNSLSRPESVTVLAGETVVLECASDSPTAYISWTHSLSPSLPINSHVLPSGPLVITNITTQDSGHYICTLTDHISQQYPVQYAFAEVTVIAPPVVTIFPTDSLTVTEQEPILLSCIIDYTSTDPVTVVWFKGQQILQSEIYTTPDLITNAIQRDSASFSDSGIYQCMAYNTAGCSQSVVTVTIEAPPTMMTSPPTVPPSPSANISVTISSDVVYCTVTGDLDQITAGVWYRDGDLVSFFGPSGDVYVSNYSLPGYGVYTCEIHFPGLEIIRVSIEYGPPPVIQTTPTTSHQAPPATNLQAPHTNTLLPTPTHPVTPPLPSSLPPHSPSVTVSTQLSTPLVHCIVSGDTSLVVEAVWLVDGVVRSQFNVETSHFFNIYHVTDYGVYTCQLTLSNGDIVSDSVTYEPPSPSPSPSPSPPSVAVNVQLTSESVHCVLEGDLNLVVTAMWLIQNDDTLLTSVIDIDDKSKPIAFFSYPMSLTATYTCYITLSDDSVLTDSIYYERPSPSPSPSPTPPPAADNPVMITKIGGFIVCSAAYSQSQILQFFILYREVDIHATPSYGESTAVITEPIIGTGLYVCVVATRDGIFQDSLEIGPPDLQPCPTLPPPQFLVAEWMDGDDGSQGNILVNWEEPECSDGLRGYKINWDQPLLIEQVAQEIVTADVFQYIITNLDTKLPYVVMVWAFTNDGDQEPARVELEPRNHPTLCPDPCPSVLPPTLATAGSPSPSPSPTHSLVSELIKCTAISPNTAIIEWKGNDEKLTLTYGCRAAGTHTTIITQHQSSSLTLNQLLPNCHYTIHIPSDTCSLTTPPGEIMTESHAIEVNGTLVVHWELPVELSTSVEDVLVEVNVTGEWIDVGSTPNHTLSPTLPVEDYIYLRFSAGNWSSIHSILIERSTETPPTEDDTSSSPSTVDNILLYGSIFIILLVACIIIAAIILMLKYVQITRRDTDKVTDHRIEQREQLRRLSMEKSSSLKKPAIHTHINGTTSNGTSSSHNHIIRVTNI